LLLLITNEVDRIIRPMSAPGRKRTYRDVRYGSAFEGTWNFNRYRLPRGSDVAVWAQTADVLPPLSDSERPKTRQPPPKSERTILTSNTENPHVSYNDFAGFSDSTFRSHSSLPAARPQSRILAINRPPMPPRRNGGRT
jgi:hypothetical protein